MPTENAVEECSKCGAVMSFVCFIDKKTKEEIPAGFMEKGTMSGGLLSGTLRRYRCSNGHAGTRENDDFPVKEFQNVEERNNFHSLHTYPGIIDKAKNRLKTLPSNWLDQLSKQIEVQG